MWGHRFMMPQLSGKMRGPCLWQSERRLGASCVFARLIKRFEKRSAGENEDLYVKIHQLFFSVHEIDHLYEQNSRTAGGEFGIEKRTIKRIDLTFRELKYVVFRHAVNKPCSYFVIYCHLPMHNYSVVGREV